MHSWWTIGKYGMRLNLGKTYRNKKVYLSLTAAIYMVFALLFAYFVQQNPNNIVLRFLEDKVLFATIMDLLLLYLFVYLVIIHVFSGIRKQNKSSIELLLSAPLRSEDIVLGETLAMIPVYLLILPAVLIPLFVLGGMQAGLGIFGMAVILVTQVLMFIIAIGIGAIILVLVQSSIQRVKFSKFFRLFASLIAAGLYLSIYGLRAWMGTAEALTQQALFSYLPTSLSANVVYAEILDAPVEPSVLYSIVLLCVWALVIYRVGVTLAGKAYSLEREMQVGHVVIKGEGPIMKLVRLITPPSQREKVVTHFKLFFRDSYNFSNSIYLIIIGYLLIIFTVWSTRDSGEMLIRMLTMQIVITPMFVAIFLTSMFYLSRDALWIWRKAPNGIQDFIKSKWLQTLLLSLVFVPVPLFAWAVAGRGVISVGYALSLMVWVLLMNGFSASFGIFINVYNPSTNIRGAKMAINSILSTFSLLIILYAMILGAVYFGVLPDYPTILEHLATGVLIGIILNAVGYVLYRVACGHIEHTME